MLNHYVWYKENPDINSPDTVHQVLALGNLVALRDIKSKLGREKIVELFLKYPKKVYTRSALNFITKFILNINKPFNEDEYLKFTPRIIKSTETRST